MLTVIVAFGAQGWMMSICAEPCWMMLFFKAALFKLSTFESPVCKGQFSQMYARRE